MAEGTEEAAARRILLADADAFFVAVARLNDPDGVGNEPLLVVGGSAARRGVVTSASYETRAYGVRSGMPMAQALHLCPHAVQVPVPGRACREKSSEIRRVLEQFTPVVEPASIDEFYMDMTGTEQMYGHEPLADTATTVRRAVIEATGIVVSIGGGTSKLIAKLAAKQAKPHSGNASGVAIVNPGDERAFLAKLDLADIPGIGPRLQERLAERGLHSVSDALTLDERELVEWLGPRSGRWLYHRIRAGDSAGVRGRRAPKSLSHEETFAADIDADRDLDRELLRLATRVASDMRSRNLGARTITVKLRDADFTTRQASKTLVAPVSSDSPIYETSRILLARLRQARRTGARLLGVATTNLVRTQDGNAQLSLLDATDEEGIEGDRDRMLGEAVDKINARFGRGRIARGSVVDPAERGLCRPHQDK